MKRLHEIISGLEAQVPDTKAEALPALYLMLAEHYDLANSSKQRFYLTKIWEDTSIADHDPIRIKAGIHYAGNLQNVPDLETAEKTGHQTLEAALAVGDISLIVEAKAVLALLYLYTDRIEEGEAYMKDSLAWIESSGSDELQMDMYVHAVYFYLDKDIARAGEYGFKALELAQRSGKKWKEGYTTSALGHWAKASGNTGKEYDYFSAAAKILHSEGAYEYYINSVLQLALAQRNRGEVQEALSTLQKALATAQQLANKRYITVVHQMMGRCYRSMKSTDMALDSFRNARAMAEETGDMPEAAVAEASIGQVYIDLDDTQQAITHLERSMELFSIANRPTNIASVTKTLHPLYLRAGDAIKAYETLLLYTETRFKMQDENRIKETAKMQAKYEAEKRESELREMKIKQQQIELERSESELKAIKAQMNPHFIFNALNSIQEMFFIGDKRLANEHLGKFSQLTREVLRASGKRYITLAEEIDMLRKYLELEGLRFESDFTFNIDLNDEDAADDILLPPMLIQPYIENSIRHGLLHKTGEKLIEVRFVFDEEKKVLSCVIEDNGVGRAASTEINKNRKGLHESFSTSANAKRLELLNQNRDEKIGVSYEDLQEGTKVSILIPVTYD